MNRRTFEKIEQHLGNQVTWIEDIKTDDLDGEEDDDESTGSETGESFATSDESGDGEDESEEVETSSVG